MKAENGYDTKDLGHTAFNVYYSCQGQPRNWHQTVEVEQHLWDKVAGMAILMVESADGLLWHDLAAKLYQARTDKADYAALPRPEQLLWEAVGRHLANLIDSDGSVEDLSLIHI